MVIQYAKFVLGGIIGLKERRYDKACKILIMRISVHLKPNSRHREEVVPNDDGSLMIYTKAPAIEGRANVAAVKLLAKHFGVASSKVKLLRGASSKYKMFEIDQSD